MDLPRRLFADTVPAYGPQFGRVVKSAAGAGTSHLTTPPAVLTYPVRDRQGDVVEPMGIDWSEFNGERERLVNFEHGPYIGTAEVEYKSMPRLDAKGQPDESLGLIALPVGVTTFFESGEDAARYGQKLYQYDASGRAVDLYDPDECFKISEHVRPLVLNGTLTGTSLEFRPDGYEGTAYKSLGPHPLLRGRPAYHFFKTKAIGFAAACDIPVNQFAGYAPPDAETLERAEKALKYCESAGSLDVIRKSLSPLTRILKATPSGRVTAPVRRDKTMSVKTAPKRVTKAGMYEDDDTSLDPNANTDATEDMTGTSADQVQDDAGAGGDMKPTPKGGFDAVQGIMDALALARQTMEPGEDTKGQDQLEALFVQIEKLAEKVRMKAEEIAARVTRQQAEEVADDVEPESGPELDDDGTIVSKSLTATGYTPKKFVTVAVGKVNKAAPWTLKQIQKAKTVAGKDGQVTVDAEYLKQLEFIRDVAAERLAGTR